MKVVFESKTKDSSKEKSSKKESSKQSPSSKESDSKPKTENSENITTNDPKDNSVENPFGDIQTPIEDDIFG